MGAETNGINFLSGIYIQSDADIVGPSGSVGYLFFVWHRVLFDAGYIVSFPGCSNTKHKDCSGTQAISRFISPGISKQKFVR
jgi:hypothetical protein